MTPPLPSPQSPALNRAGAAQEGVLFGLLVCFMLSTRALQPPVWIDDAFIHFRNARNFAEGLGLVYNPGERVIGSTSPVFVFLLGLGSRMSGLEVPLLAQGLNACADAVTAGLVIAMLAGFGVPRLFRYAIALAVFAEPLGLVYSAAGMEMSVFLLAALGIVAAVDRGRWLVAGLLLGVLGWIRPEGVTVGVAVLLALAMDRRPDLALRLLGATAAAAIVAAAVLLFAYGTVLPQSLLAKAGSPWFPDWGRQDGWLFFVALARLGALPAFFPKLAAEPVGSDLAVVVGFAVLQLVLMAAGVMRARQARPVAAVALGTFAGMYYLFYALANPMMFEWYYVPWAFLSLLLGGLGLWAAAERALEFAAAHGELRADQLPRWRSGAALLAAGVLVLAQANAARTTGHFAVESGLSRLAFRFADADPFDRLRLYQKAARVMDGWRAVVPDAIVATPEIGVFGWHYGGNVLDPYALVSPKALGVLAPEAQAALAEEVRGYHPVNVYLHERPEFILTAGMFLPYVPEEMKREYREFTRADVPLLRLFMRRDLPDAVQRAILTPAGG